MTYFVLCIHNHQPVGNFTHVLEECYEKAYWPFLKTISKYPSIKLTLHNTGFLLDWIIENRPEYIDLLKTMVESGQVELMGGGYYEPILSVIPEVDRLNQIQMMSDKISEVFGTRPRGIWLAERVWEPALPTTLKKAGIEYLLLDDYHFVKSGLDREELGGYYITEDQGKIIKIFPGSEMLRYLIPFRPVEHLEDHLKELSGFLRLGNAAIYGDDGEKFGSWPGTHKWVYDEGWLEAFFKMIERNLSWLKPVTMGEFTDREEHLGRVYLPTTSYMEMGEWALPANASKTYTELVEEIKSWNDGARIRRFLQGGIWRNFFSKYPEANWMHKRMLLVSKSLNERMERTIMVENVTKAEKCLFMAQSNDAYWHGIFGGLYLPHLRRSVYENLIKAENLMDSETFANTPVDEPAVSVIRGDFDADNNEEIVIRTRDLNLFLSPRHGGSIVEWDFRPAAVNLSNTVSRWYEGYHNKLEATGGEDSGGEAKSIHEMVKVKEKGLEKYLKYDKIQRTSLLEHFLGGEETLKSFFANDHKELGDFHTGEYKVEVKNDVVQLLREGKVNGKDVSLNKWINIEEDNSFRVDYSIRGIENGVLPEGGRFAVELNVMLPGCDGPLCYYEIIPNSVETVDTGLGTSIEAHEIEKISLVDKFSGVRLTIGVDRSATLWSFPIYTVSLSEGGFERIYQGSCLLFLFPLELDTERRKHGIDIGFRIKSSRFKGLK